MSSLKDILDGLKVTAKISNSKFMAAREREPLFAPFASSSALYEALDVRGPLSVNERSALARVLITEYQRERQPLWQALLMQAQRPMLLKLRREVDGSGNGDDLDQKVLLHFIEWVRMFPLEKDDERILMHLRQGTRRALFRALNIERAENDEMEMADGHLEDVEDTGWFGEPRTTAEHELFDALEMNPKERKQLAFLLRHKERSNESLRAWVHRVYCNQNRAARERVYARLKRQRTRVLRELRRSARVVKSAA
jgi:hypothetical protein